MSNETPGWLTAACSELFAASESTFAEDHPAEVMDGDVCVVEPFGQPDEVGRLLMVTESGDGWCEGMLMGIETELATEVDGILSPAESGLEYETAAHTRFSGPVWITQVRRRAGAATESVLDQLVALSFSDEPEGVELRRGMPLQPAGIDPRYPSLQALSEGLEQLTEDCRRGRYELVSVIDPAVASVDVLEAFASEPGFSSFLETAQVQGELVDRLLEALPRLSPDMQRAVTPLIERSLLATRPSGSSPAEPLVLEHREPAVLSGVVQRAATGRPAIRVLSHRMCWITAPHSLRLRTSDTVVVFASINSTQLQEAA